MLSHCSDFTMQSSLRVGPKAVSRNFGLRQTYCRQEGPDAQPPDAQQPRHRNLEQREQPIADLAHPGTDAAEASRSDAPTRPYERAACVHGWRVLRKGDDMGLSWQQ